MVSNRAVSHIETRQLIFSAVQINCPNFIMTKLALTHLWLLFATTHNQSIDLQFKSII